ncbi:MAG: putative ATP-dependent transporter SufC [Turneriella sp.]|nr:putative ATP-dependent transporter SufC [Turneriella sp.]
MVATTEKEKITSQGNLMQKNLLNIENLKATTADKKILNGINLSIAPGEIHAIMGPNGSGKSTLSHVLAGNPDFTVTGGSVTFDGVDLLSLPIEERARKGLFIAFQYPPEIPGVNNIQFMRTALNTIRKAHGQAELNAIEFLKIVKEVMARLEMKPEMIQRSLNDGFSGGEKKKNEILQMTLLGPRLTILDEIDSGLDVDALELVAKEAVRNMNEERSMVVITHYSRILKYIKPTHVHVLSGGKIIESGGMEIVHRIEEKGY